jgi:hypothetical protein
MLLLDWFLCWVHSPSPQCQLCPRVPGGERCQDDPQPPLFTGYHPSGLFSLTVLGQLQEELDGDHADHRMISMVEATNIVQFTKIPGILLRELREFKREKSEISISPFKEIESRDIILFLKDLFEKIIVLSFTACGCKIGIFCHH